ncbi:MAG: hypothetical protein JJT75_00800, partial [Opitutales bacterium]|nr:hypothetical protein [Opitutales bacterium]
MGQISPTCNGEGFRFPSRPAFPLEGRALPRPPNGCSTSTPADSTRIPQTVHPHREGEGPSELSRGDSNGHSQPGRPKGQTPANRSLGSPVPTGTLDCGNPIAAFSSRSLLRRYPQTARPTNTPWRDELCLVHRMVVQRSPLPILPVSPKRSILT